MYDLTTATFEDAGILAKLWVDTFTQAYDEVHTLKNIQTYCQNNFTLNQARKELLDEKTTCVISRRNSQVNGFYLIKEVGCPVPLDESSIELKQIYILSNEYGLGLGKRLYDDVIRTVQGHSIKWLWLSVSDINFRALSFYKKLNFNAIGKGPTFEVGSDILTSTIMAKCVG